MASVSATANNLRVSARKIGLVAGLIRGRSAKDAAVILEHTPKAAARDLAKIVKSAQANAENNAKLDVDKLVIERILVSNGGMIKRGRPGGRGTWKPFRHRLSNVTVVLDEVKSPSNSSSKKPAVKKASERTTK